jgi:hypothetical protein
LALFLKTNVMIQIWIFIPRWVHTKLQTYIGTKIIHRNKLQTYIHRYKIIHRKKNSNIYRYINIQSNQKVDASLVFYVQ